MNANNFRIIIDGYNLIFQCGLEGRSRSPRALERARNSLVATLANRLDDDERARTIIVFDAEKLPISVSEAQSVNSGINIEFAVNHDDADTLIEELIAKNSTSKQLVVVSSDHRIQKAALRRRATAIDSDVWYEKLIEGKRAPRRQEPQAKPEKDVSSLEEVDWNE